VPTPTAARIPFIDLQAQRARLGGRIDAAIERVLEHGRFILGPEVAELEDQLARYCGVAHAVGCSSGTDALVLALMARQIGPGDAVLVPSFTFPGTAEVAALLGATPVFVDVLPDTFNVDPARLADGLDAARGAGLVPRALIAVDLFGQPAEYDAIEPACRDHDLVLVVDAAQSLGAAWGDRRAGAIGDLAAASFFPSKPLGCYGDGGAVFTGDHELAGTVRSLRSHGQGAHKYDTVRVGLNARLDTIQAAIVLAKLTIFDEELEARRRVAARYATSLGDAVTVPVVRPAATSAWAQYTVQADDRDSVMESLNDAGVPTAVHYPKPLHRQPAYTSFPTATGGLPVAEQIGDRVLSLPMHPYLDEETQAVVVAAVQRAVA